MAYDACEISPTRPPHHIHDIEVTGSSAGPNVVSDPDARGLIMATARKQQPTAARS
jgi:hypothetical protein